MVGRLWHYGVLLGAGLLGSFAAATTPHCFSSLNGLSSDTKDPRPRIVEVYLDLWRALAAGKLNAKQAEAWLAEPDPLKIPSNVTGDFGELQRRLTEFGELLNKKGWQLSAVSEALVDARLELLRGLIGASQKTDVILQTEGDNGAKAIVLPGAESGTITADGGWIYTAARDGALSRLFAHDTFHNRTIPLDIAVPGLHGPHLIPDGSGLFLLKEGQPSLRFFTLKEGLPVPDGTVEVARKGFLFNRFRSGAGVPVGAAVGRSSHLIVARYENPSGFHLFDRQAGTIATLKVPLEASEKVVDWGFVPGTDDLYFLVGKRMRGWTAGFQQFEMLRQPLPLANVPARPGQTWHWFAGTDSQSDSVHFKWQDGGQNAAFGFNRPPSNGGKLSAGAMQLLHFPPTGMNNNSPVIRATVDSATKIRSVSRPGAGHQVLLATESEREGFNQLITLDPANPKDYKTGPRLPHTEGFRVSTSPEKVFVFGKSGVVQWVWDYPSKPTR